MNFEWLILGNTPVDHWMPFVHSGYHLWFVMSSSVFGFVQQLLVPENDEPDHGLHVVTLNTA